ncbi:prepilin peptidase [Parasphingorhabdus halotolerans]|uniref:Prepilin leader peptidase/N-methyltransferase n=1 Tax=Parasphingorhabdus halotolerans TaxID=2725558 RepID=A0A6H2DIN8_9SPHN|nr:A24 family peptidase [Parasphingorhabdus halotolerans]QJB68539.1 prepilin peptidase [Parasphingorhabdus halotolerans]
MAFFLYPLAGVILGLIIGSFLATLVIRWPQGRSVVAGRSHCDHCNTPLVAIDLIPVLSFILATGKCRQCHHPIKPDHLAIELAAAAIGGLALYISPDCVGLTGAIFGWLLIALAALDTQHHWLPDELTFLLAASGLAASLVINEPELISRLIGGVTGFGSLWLIALAYGMLRKREGLGGGDPKILGAIGCWLGWSMLPFVLLGAALIGLAAALTMRWRGEAIAADSALPLGSYMAITAFPLWLYQTGSGGFPF